MDYLESDNVKNVGPDEYPLYTNEPLEPIEIAKKLPQGPGSGTDADTVDGFQAARSGPNKLIVSDSNGRIRGTTSYVAFFVSTDVSTATDFTINLSTGTVSAGTLTFLNGVMFPADATVLYSIALKSSSTSGSPSAASNPSISSTQAQNFTASSNIIVTVGNNPAGPYTATGVATFFGVI